MEQNILQKLEALQFSNNGDIWNLLKQMKGNNIEKQFSDEALRSIQDLSKHYKKLLQKKHNQTIKQPNENKSFKNFKNFDSLNEDITIEEIKQTIKKLKSKKGSRKQQHYERNDKVL